MDWRSIRTYNGSQNNAFEELVCQLARIEKIDTGVRFVKVGAPDSGVECFWTLEDGSEIVWQAKFVFDIDSVLTEANKSFLSAIKGHSRMIEFILAIPFDLPDPSYKRNGKQVKSALKKWDEKVDKWKSSALEVGIKVNITLWDSSALLARICKPVCEGLQYFWFNESECTSEWFYQNLECSICDLGPRYSPEINVELDIARKFEYLRRSSTEKQRILQYREKLEKGCENFKKEFLIKHEITKYFQEFEKVESELFEILSFVGYAEMQELPLQTAADKMNELMAISDKFMEVIKKKLDTKAYYESDEYSSYSELQNVLWEGVEKFEKELKLLNQPAMLLFGDAGTGKSHLLADVACNLKNANLQSILLLGEKFASSIDPRVQITQSLQSNMTFTKMLQILNSIGQTNGERFLFMIDALNEGDGNLIWPVYLKGLLNEISKYPWIACVISVRTENVEEIISEDCDEKLVKVRHTGFDETLESACDKFFEHYQIDIQIPMLTEEFSNPLYLKLFCESYSKSKEIKSVPSISEVFLKYSDFVNSKLSQTRYFRYNKSVNLVLLCIDAIARAMLDTGKNSLSYVEALTIVNNVKRNICEVTATQYKSFLDALINENIFKAYRIYGEDEKNISFSYERMGEYFLIKNKLESKAENSSIIELINHDDFFSGIFDGQSYRYRNKVMMLSILVPEKYGVELMECIEDKRIPFYIIECFLQSFIWRKDRTVDEKILEWMKECARDNAEFKKLMIDSIMPMCSLPDSSFNIMFLHNNFLKKEKCSVRDVWWTMHINECYEQMHPIVYRRIIRWSWNIEQKRSLSQEARKLLGVTLLWFCTSNNRELRDFATKGLVCLYRENVDEILSLYELFSDVNDLYVLERLYAATFGAIVYCEDKKVIKLISDYILDTVFRKEKIIAHVTIRDFSREIVEYALYKEVYLEREDIEKAIKPPYKSDYPKRFPTETTIRKLEQKYDDDNAFSYVLSSMRMDMGYGDFGRYIFDYSMKEFSGVDVYKLSRWVIKRTLQLGFDPKLHDNKIPGYYGRRGGKVERLGKKYQWIAFYEIAALVADHFLLKADYGETEEKACNEKWYSEFRNIDPTLLIYNTKILDYKQAKKTWVSDFEYLPIDMNTQEWITETPSFIDKIIKCKDPEGCEWFFLTNSPFWNFYKENDSGWNDELTPLMRGYVNSYIIHKSDLVQIKRLYAERPNEFIHGFEVDNNYKSFLREYFWSSSYQGDARENIWENLKIGNQKTDITYAKTTIRHIWEGEYDYSKDDTIAFDVPGEIIVKGMNLKYQEMPGKYFSGERLICFNPGMELETNQMLLIDKSHYEKWLEENGFCSLWIVTIEKYITSHRERGRFARWDGLYILSDSKIEGDMKYREEI